MVCQTRLKRACIVGKDKQTKPRILTGSQVTRKEITSRKTETAWLYRPTPVIIIRRGPQSSVAIAGFSYASVEVLVRELAVKSHSNCPNPSDFSVTH